MVIDTCIIYLFLMYQWNNKLILELISKLFLLFSYYLNVTEEINKNNSLKNGEQIKHNIY